MGESVMAGTDPSDSPPQALRDHLESALEYAENTDARFHIRSALQLLEFSDPVD